MTIAAVPPTGIDIARAAPPADAAAGGFEEMLAGAQTKTTEEKQPEPVADPAAKRPVRTAPRDATKTAEDAADTDAPDATEAGDGTGEQPVTDATDTDATANDAATVVAPIVVAPVLPDSGIGQIVLELLAELDGAVETEATVPVVVADATAPEIVTTVLPVAAEGTSETQPAAVETGDGAVASEPIAVADDATPATMPATADTTRAADTTPKASAHTAPHAASAETSPEATADTTGTASGPATETGATPRPAPVPTTDAVVTTAEAMPAMNVAPTSQAQTQTQPDDTRRGPSDQASPAALAAVTAREMPAVSRGAEVSAMHTATAPAGAPPAEQLVSVLRPLRTAPDGSYRIHLELRPAELGRVELRVEMRDGVLHASLHADNEGAARTLQNALGDLRARLEGTGVRAGSLSVDDGRTGADRQANRDAPRNRGDQSIPDTPIVASLTASAAANADSGLDVRL